MEAVQNSQPDMRHDRASPVTRGLIALTHNGLADNFRISKNKGVKSRTEDDILLCISEIAIRSRFSV